MQLDQLDPVTTEVVRLRAANYHDCKMRLSLRLAVAGRVVAGEELAAKIFRDDAAGFPAEHRVALRYADAHMTGPARIDGELREGLHRCFTIDQIVELTLDVAAWNRQKVMVALDIDRPVDDRSLSALTFDARGHHQVSGTL